MQEAKTYLFVWNPKRWQWDDLDETVKQADKDGTCPVRWSCGTSKVIRPGDRVFLIRVGLEPKGIIGSGFATSAPFPSVHWADPKKKAYYVEAQFEKLINPEKNPILPMEVLKTGKLAKQLWTPQNSGISIRPEVALELEALWFDFINNHDAGDNPFLLNKDQSPKTYAEGTPSEVTLTKYERNPFARKTCIEHYGMSCFVCGFNFKKVYGKLGDGFIHVHHILPLNKVAKKYKVDPIKDLRPVCPNCHAMIHRTIDTISIEEIKALLN